MQTIELEGKKAITKFDLDRAPTTAFVEHRGELYHIEQSGGLLWELTDEPLPDGADLTIIANDGTMTVKPAAPTLPHSSPPEAPHDASPDHAETV